MRQQYGMAMIPILEKGMRVINIDESWLNGTTFIRRMWAPKKDTCSTVIITVTPRLSLLAAIDTEGQSWFSLTQATTDSDVLYIFFVHLIQILDLESPNWRESVVFLLDGARPHTST